MVRKIEHVLLQLEVWINAAIEVLSGFRPAWRNHFVNFMSAFAILLIFCPVSSHDRSDQLERAHSKGNLGRWWSRRRPDPHPPASAFKNDIDSIPCWAGGCWAVVTAHSGSWLPCPTCVTTSRTGFAPFFLFDACKP